MPSRPTPRIMSGVATTASKSIQPPRIFSTTSSPPTCVGAGFLGFLLLVGAGNHQHALALAQAVRQDDRAADHLVGVLGIDAQAHRELDRLVELRELDLLHQRQRFGERVGPILHLRLGRLELLAHCCFAFLSLPPRVVVTHLPSVADDGGAIRIRNYAITSSPIDRAVPATVLIADSSESVFRSGIFSFAISSTCFCGDRADLVLVRLGRSLGDVRGALEQHRRRRRLGDERVRTGPSRRSRRPG